MLTIEKRIEVECPRTVVYDQWTQFELFPQFMDGVTNVTQVGNKRLHWKAQIGGKEKEWDAEIFEQLPDERIAWRSMGGNARNSGMVNFTSVSPTCTQICLRLNYDPVGVLEKIGSVLGVVSSRVGHDLKRFKRFIEDRRVPTEEWRGEIHGREVRPPRV